MENENIIRILEKHNLKVTPQRTAVLELIMNVDTHPTAEEIANQIKDTYPNMSIGTIYKILDKFAASGIIEKMNTNNGIMRYDAVKEKHYHLYSLNSERIDDYYDSELRKLLDNYFKNKKFPNFKMKDLQLQIIGEFTNDKTK
ncbi:MAG: Fur family transcriptional regulator [Bacteroidales bacterium]|jgi:Fur family peroxide stress response transcriptional regulator